MCVQLGNIGSALWKQLNIFLKLKNIRRRDLESNRLLNRFTTSSWNTLQTIYITFVKKITPIRQVQVSRRLKASDLRVVNFTSR